MNNPWASPDLSTALPELRARGESEVLEYMVSFPTNARELGKEIAAFATSGSGRILIGVTDDGDIAGLPNAATAEGRDELLQRLQGICHGMVNPAVTPLIQFGIDGDRIVLCIEMLDCPEPVYYCNHVPYIRHLTQSRPAEPHEVVTLVQEWLATDKRVHPVAQAVATAWVNLTLFSLDLRGWQLGNHLHEFLSYLRDTAGYLRDAATSDEAVNEHLEDPLRMTAGLLEKSVAVPRVLGSAASDAVSNLVGEARSTIDVLYHGYVDKIVLTRDQVEEANRICREHTRRAIDLLQRMGDAIESDRFVELLRHLSWEGNHIFTVLAMRGQASQKGALAPEARAAAELFNQTAKDPFFTDRQRREHIIVELEEPLRVLRARFDVAAV